MRKAGMALLLAFALVVLVPAAAIATPRTTSRIVSQTSGARIAEQLLSQMRGLQVGASAATVTVDVAGHPKPIRVDFGEVTGPAPGSSGSGLLVLAMVPFAASMFFRAVRFLSSLGR